MSGEEVPDIEDIFLGDISDQPRQSSRVHNVKKALKKKKEPKVKEEKEYEPSIFSQSSLIL